MPTDPQHNAEHKAPSADTAPPALLLPVLPDSAGRQISTIAALADIPEEEI